MVCITVTIVQAKPVVSGLSVTLRTDIQGWADVSWYQDVAGAVSLKVDGTQMGSATAGKAGSNYALLGSLSVGSHQVCVDAI
jgi:hypothetical protein